MKRVVLKLFCVALSVLLACTSLVCVTASAQAEAEGARLFPIWVGGVQVTSANCGDVLGDGKVRFEPEAYVLFLADGAVIESAEVSLYGDVDFEGYEVCVASEAQSLTVRLGGKVSLKLPKEAKNHSAGLISCGNTLIQGKGTLSVLGGDARKNASYGLISLGTLSLEGGAELNAEGSDNASASLGVLAYLDVELLEGSKLNAKGGTAQALSAGLYCSLRRPVTVENAALSCEGSSAETSVGLFADLVCVKGGALSAKGKSYGIATVSNVNGKISASEGTLTAQGEKSALYETELKPTAEMSVSLSAAADGVLVPWDGSSPLADESVKALTVSFSAEEQLLGDVNGDGTTDALDAALILRADCALESLDAKQLKRADLNGDGTADALDAAQILKKDAGIAD